MTLLAKKTKVLRRVSFTLIELMIVVVIFAILVSILMPSLRIAREKAFMAACGSQESEMGKGMMSYSIQNNRYLPGATVRAGAQHMVWATRIKEYMSDNYEIFNCPKQADDVGWQENLTSFGAPEEYGYKENEARIYYNTQKFAYGMNDWGIRGYESGGKHLGLGTWITSPDEKGKVMLTDIVNPSEMISIGDSTPNKHFDTIIDPMNPKEQPGNRHLGGAMISFVDGHARFYEQRIIISGGDDIRKLWNNDNVPNH